MQSTRVAILGVDVGGTFTDAVLLDGGTLRTAKVPTAARQEDSVLAAARAVGAASVERFAHGTTVATNALLERRGSRTAFVGNEGFEHLLHLRRQTRAHLYRLCAQHPEPLVPLDRCYGVRGRLGPDGELGTRRAGTPRRPRRRRCPAASRGRAGLVFRAFGEALPVPAQGQGTMNNVALGNDRFTYYETTGGGQGACRDADGPSGVHVAMSNTLSTPVEALELSYPLRVERWELRTGSGGAGARRGGDGVVRELRVLEDCRLSVLAERRAHGPRGADGGGAGAPGRTLVNVEEQPATMTKQLAAGDVVRIETPGGGGFGQPKE